MNRYKAIKNGVVISEWLSTLDNETRHEPGWGLPERPELDEQGEPTGVILPAEYVIEVEDMTAEIEAQEMKKRETELNEVIRKTARDKVVAKNIDLTKITDKVTLKQLIEIVQEQAAVIKDMQLWMSKVK